MGSLFENFMCFRCSRVVLDVLWIGSFCAALLLIPNITVQAETTSRSDPNSALAKHLFAARKNPAQLDPAPIGSYAKGCLAGGAKLAQDGPNWQAMRLSRNRHWGHPRLLQYIEVLAEDANALEGWPGLLVGDMSQPRGGPMLGGHRSHQIGLDADIWLLPAPSRKLAKAERESLSAISVRKNNYQLDHKVWSEQHARLLRRAASYPEVARIFVHPTIKRELCGWADQDRAWLRRIRPWYGHHYHFHVRLKCPDGTAGCKNQPEPPAGDGCGAELDWWFSEEAYAPDPKASKRKPLRLVDLPKQCQSVLNAR